MIKLVENYKDSIRWYRKYSDGFIEQGGKSTRTFATDETWVLVFPRAFTSPPLSFSITCIAPRTADASGSELGVISGSLTATGVTLCNDSYGTNKTGFYWEARGY